MVMLFIYLLMLKGDTNITTVALAVVSHWKKWKVQCWVLNVPFVRVVRNPYMDYSSAGKRDKKKKWERKKGRK